MVHLNSKAGDFASYSLPRLSVQSRTGRKAMKVPPTEADPGKRIETRQGLEPF